MKQGNNLGIHFLGGGTEQNNYIRQETFKDDFTEKRRLPDDAITYLPEGNNSMLSLI